MRGLYNRSSISTAMRRESLDFLRRWRDLSTCRIAVVVVGWFPLSLFSLLLLFFKGLLLDDIMLNCYTDDGVRAKQEKGRRRIWARFRLAWELCICSVVFQRAAQTNVFWRFTFYDIFLSFFLFCFLFLFPLCNCLFGRVTVCLVPFSNLLLLRTRKKKKRVTEDKAVN